MKKALQFILALFLISNSMLYTIDVNAVPAYPHPIEFTQPDGSVITIQLKGDEKVNWAETMDGYTILVNSNGEYQYAIIDESGDLTFSGIVVSNINSRTFKETSLLSEIEKGLFFSKIQVQIMTEVWEMKDKSKAKAFPTTGNRKMFCVLMQTPDKSFIKTKAEFNALFNQLNYTVGGATGSVKDYYLENSYGQLDLTVDVFGPYTASQNMSYYASDARPLVTQGVQAANAEANFADYDNDGDGWVDGVYMIFAGYGQEAGGGTGTIWSHAWAINPIQLDGKWISSYACSPELRGNTGTNITRIGVIGHEFGHVLGAPDYYDVNYEIGGQFEGTGEWDMMAGGSWNNGGATPAHHNGFTKVYFFNWASATILSTPSTITLHNAAENSNSFYRYNTNTSGEYFLVENREKHKFDSSIPGSGMIIYHVHSGVMTAASSNSINNTHPQRMYPVAQNATMDPTSTPSSYGNIYAANCAWTGTSGKTSFTDATLPSSKSWAGANTAKPITSILRNGTAKTVTFDFMGGGTNPNVVTFNVSDQYGHKIENAQITVTKTSKELKTISTPILKTPISNKAEFNLSAIKSESQTTVVNSDGDKASWIHWDDGGNNSSIGIGDPGGIWYGAIKFLPAEITGYNGMEITKIRVYINHLANSASVIISQGTEGSLNELTRQSFTQSASSWVEVTLSSSVSINASQELWIAVEIDDPGIDIFPLGVDATTSADGKSNLVSFDFVTWDKLSDYALAGDWNIQAYVEEALDIVLFTNANGQATFEADLANYSYVAEKAGYTTANGNFIVSGETTTVNIIMQNLSTTTPVVTTNAVTLITATTARSGGSVTSDGGSTVTLRGIAYATTQNPTTANSTVPSGIGTGNFVSDMTGLAHATTYYVRAFATNANGTSYGQQFSFTTLSSPTVSTNNITSITATSATSGGNVTADGGASVTQRGIAYATTQNPTTSNSVVYSGTGTGSYTSNMAGLTPSTTYYVRAFATNIYGTTYGLQKSFTTTATATTPTVTTTVVTGITATTANTGGNVTADGGATVTSRGVVYAKTQNPTTANNSVSGGSGTGSYNVALSSLSPNTTYYVRAFAVNNQGTAYGTQRSFTTAEDNTSISDAEENAKSLVVFPNPASDMVSITSNNNIKAVRVFDIFGNMVYVAALGETANKHQINMNEFAAGIYFVQISNKEGVFTSKLQILK